DSVRHTWLIHKSYCSVNGFFFQAEDGIRDRNVTGVQTCALPILPIKKYKPTTPGRRGMSSLTFEEITTNKPEKSLVVSLKSKGEIGRASCRKECRTRREECSREKKRIEQRKRRRQIQRKQRSEHT